MRVWDHRVICFVSLVVAGSSCIEVPNPGAHGREDAGIEVELTSDTDEGDGQESSDEGDEEKLDLPGPDLPDLPGCAASEAGCGLIDVLFVIDNSGTMGEEQLNLAANLPALVDELRALTDNAGAPLEPSVNIMFTTTDVGHPQCTPFEPEGYSPLLGAPQEVACIDRLDDFEGLGLGAPSFPEACTSACPVKVEPSAPFIHFEGPTSSWVTNVPGNNVAGAVGCLGPQGINGCGFEAPLEAMLQALDPGAAWSTSPAPFLRDGAILAIVIVTDEADCSVRAPEGYAYFTTPSQNVFWEPNPETGTKTHATSAVCWNAGVDCGAPDGNGVYADCEAIDAGVLHPLSRYTEYLRDELPALGKEVVMLGLVGIPPVTKHHAAPPYAPNGGGVLQLVYRQWNEQDILPTEPMGVSAATKEFEYGIGPGCTGRDAMDNVTGQAIPPVRVRELCEALDEDEQLRCCLESICAPDFSDAFRCLAGMVQTLVDPP